MKISFNWQSALGLIAGLVYSVFSFYRYYILFPDTSTVILISNVIIGILIVMFSLLYNKCLIIDRDRQNEILKLRIEFSDRLNQIYDKFKQVDANVDSLQVFLASKLDKRRYGNDKFGFPKPKRE